jgi:hypothetical protein
MTIKRVYTKSVSQFVSTQVSYPKLLPEFLIKSLICVAVRGMGFILKAAFSVQGNVKKGNFYCRQCKQFSKNLHLHMQGRKTYIFCTFFLPNSC